MIVNLLYLTKVFDELGWKFKVEDDGKTFFIQNCSPAGHDLGFEIEAENDSDFVEKLKNYFENFDPEEETQLWYGQNRGEPSSLTELLEDMQESKKMYHKLYLEANRAFKMLHDSHSHNKSKYKFEFTSKKTICEKTTFVIEADSKEKAKEIASSYSYEDFDDWHEDPKAVKEESLTWRIL